jgi:hypothetical protein
MVAMKEEEAIYKNKQTKNPRSISKKKKKKTSCHLHKRNYIVTHPTATPTNNGPSIFLEKKKNQVIFSPSQENLKPATTNGNKERHRAPSAHLPSATSPTASKLHF